MAGGASCTYPSDFGSGTAFTLQVSNATSSKYANKFVTVPVVSTGIAQLSSGPGQTFWLAGTLQQGCNRNSPLCAVVSNNEYCTQIKPSASGRAAVVTVKNVDSSQAYWLSLTEEFYVDNKKSPFSLAIKDAGGYYACSNSAGGVDLYFRLNTTTTAKGCEDVLLNIITPF